MKMGFTYHTDFSPFSHDLGEYKKNSLNNWTFSNGKCESGHDILSFYDFSKRVYQKRTRFFDKSVY